MDEIMRDQRCHFVPERIRHLAGMLGYCPQDVCRWSSQRGLDFAFLRQPRIAAQSISLPADDFSLLWSVLSLSMSDKKSLIVSVCRNH